MAISAHHIMCEAREVINVANRTYKDALDSAKIIRDEALRESEVLVNLAQKHCGHEYVERYDWTEDGAFPNEPRSRMDCTVCGKEGV